MTSKLNHFQAGYAIIRCALAYGNAYLPHVSPKVSMVARQTLLAFDFLSAAYVGWHIHKKIQEIEYNAYKIKLNVDLAVKGVTLLALSTLFVAGTNTFFLPKLNPKDLLQNTQIPKEAFQNIAEESMDYVTAVWKKTLLENLTTGLTFTHTILDLYLAHLTSIRQSRLDLSPSQSLFLGLVHAMSLFKISQYKTLEIKHSFSSFLLQKIDYSYFINGSYPELTKKFFAVPIKKVDAIFYLDVEGLTEQSIINNMQSIYNYSVNMFKKSTWHRYWTNFYYPKDIKDYFALVIPPVDQGTEAFNNCFWYPKLNYQISIKGTPPSWPVKVRVLHEDQIWQSFKGVDLFRWIPRFAVPAKEIHYSTWVNVNLSLPSTQIDSYIAKIMRFLEIPEI